MGMRKVLLLASLASAMLIVCGVSLVAPPDPARAASTGGDGKITFMSNRDNNLWEIYTMNPDGSEPTRLTHNTSEEHDPVWSPDGTKIAFTSFRDGQAEIYVMNADGSNQTNISNNPAHDHEPTWSPDGSKIAFSSVRDGNLEIYVMGADGSAPTRLTNSSGYDAQPTWSPTTAKIAFMSNRDGNYEIYVMGADGSHQANVTNNPAADSYPEWSPNGTQIAFSSNRNPDGFLDIYVMAEGEGSLTRLTSHPAEDSKPAWSPDGTKIVFQTLRGGPGEPTYSSAGELYVMNTDGSAQTNLTNNPASDLMPNWQRPSVEASPVVTIDSAPETATRAGARFTFSSSESDATFKCNLRRESDNYSTGWADCGANGAGNIAYGSGLTPGSWVFTVKAYDATGNFSAATHSFVVEDPPGYPAPVTTITGGPSEGETINTNTVTFEFSANEPDVTFECFLGVAGKGGPEWGGVQECNSGRITFSDLVDSSQNYDGEPDDGKVGNDYGFTVRATDAEGNVVAWNDVTWRRFRVDTKPPQLSLPADITEEATGPNGAQVRWQAPTATDENPTSPTAMCSKNSGDAFPIGTTTVTCSATDAAGNEATESFDVKVQDTTDPNNVTFVGGIKDGDSFLFGDVPPQPTCTAEDAVGVKSCIVSGYSSAVGDHTLMAQAKDAAGNVGTKTLSYKVLPWTLKGFQAPVDMGGTLNTAKNGSTVPLKFEVFKGTTELTDTAVVKTFTQKTNCVSGTTEDAIENYATGATSLRYDATSGQFVFNWQTPKEAGACYKVTMTAQDGSQIAANFKLK